MAAGEGRRKRSDDLYPEAAFVGRPTVRSAIQRRHQCRSGGKPPRLQTQARTGQCNTTLPLLFRAVVQRRKAFFHSLAGLTRLWIVACGWRSRPKYRPNGGMGALVGRRSRWAGWCWRCCGEMRMSVRGAQPPRGRLRSGDLPMDPPRQGQEDASLGSVRCFEASWLVSWPALERGETEQRSGAASPRPCLQLRTGEPFFGPISSCLRRGRDSFHDHPC